MFSDLISKNIKPFPYFLIENILPGTLMISYKNYPFSFTSYVNNFKTSLIL